MLITKKQNVVSTSYHLISKCTSRRRIFMHAKTCYSRLKTKRTKNEKSNHIVWYKNWHFNDRNLRKARIEMSNWNCLQRFWIWTFHLKQKLKFKNEKKFINLYDFQILDANFFMKHDIKICHDEIWFLM